MKFLERERSVVARLAENQHSKKRGNDNARGYSKTYHVERGAKHGQRTYYKCAFPTHRKDTIIIGSLTAPKSSHVPHVEVTNIIPCCASHQSSQKIPGRNRKLEMMGTRK
jgi:hypothetical protein